jgi:hypothetical protein
MVYFTTFKDVKLVLINNIYKRIKKFKVTNQFSFTTEDSLAEVLLKEVGSF